MVKLFGEDSDPCDPHEFVEFWSLVHTYLVRLLHHYQGQSILGCKLFFGGRALSSGQLCSPVVRTLHRLEEAQKRDHRRIGRELDLFHFEDVSPGSPFWHPKGMVIWNELTELWRTLNLERGYQEVRTPIIFNVDVWKKSGHWEAYRENMYFTEVENGEFGLKPMNCPGHIFIFADALRSYRDLPMRLSEQGLVHRHEPSGTLHGLTRVRHITQDDAHIFCSHDQIEDEVIGCLELAGVIYDTSAWRCGWSCPPVRPSGSAQTSSGTPPRTRCGRRWNAPGWSMS